MPRAAAANVDIDNFHGYKVAIVNIVPKENYP
jgi:hypothetical protein